jgi:hypothetical protein
MRLDVARSGSRKIPPRKTRKKRSIIASENPAVCRERSVVVSGRLSSSSRLEAQTRRRRRATRSLSVNDPIGEKRVRTDCSGRRHGSVTR